MRDAVLDGDCLYQTRRGVNNTFQRHTVRDGARTAFGKDAGSTEFCSSSRVSTEWPGPGSKVIRLIQINESDRVSVCVSRCEGTSTSVARLSKSAIGRPARSRIAPTRHNS